MNFTKTKCGGYEIEQRQMILELLESAKMEECNGTMIPISENYEEELAKHEKLLPKEKEQGKVSVQDFQSVVGSLLWLARCTRPDILFAVHKMTRKTHAPTEGDWMLAVKTIRYLKETINVKLLMTPSASENGEFQVSAYSDT
jgi:thiamine kinase-like enzyme